MTNSLLNRTSVTVLTNKSGGAVAYGDVVILGSATAKAFTTTTTSAYKNSIVGVVIEPAGIANNAQGKIAVGGWVPQVNLASAASLYDLIKTHTVAKQGTPHASPIVAGDFAIALQASATPEAVLFGAPEQVGSADVPTLVQDWKESCRVATTANITLSGTQTIDGVSVIAGDRVLVKDQSTGAENGIYVCAAGAWSRATDADTSAEVTANMAVAVEAGTANGDKIFILTTNNPITLGSTALTFTALSTGGGGAGIYPQDCIAFINQFKVASGVTGGIVLSTLSTQLFNLYGAQGTPADGDKIQTTILLKAGTYDVFVLGATDGNRGKIDWDLDGAAAFISGQDWYNAGAQNSVVKTGTATVAADGRHLLSATINGKNASSSNYFFVLTAIWFRDQSQASET